MPWPSLLGGLRVFPDQGWNLCLLHWQADSLWATREAPLIQPFVSSSNAGKTWSKAVSEEYLSLFLYLISLNVEGWLMGLLYLHQSPLRTWCPSRWNLYSCLLHHICEFGMGPRFSFHICSDPFTIIYSTGLHVQNIPSLRAKNLLSQKDTPLEVAVQLQYENVLSLIFTCIRIQIKT